MAKMIGIDLGTAYTRVVMRGRGTVLSQPTVVATDASGKEILAVGNDAAQMTGKTDGDVRVVWPLKDSVIVHCNEAGGMLEEYINTAIDALWAHPFVVASVPWGITEIERRAVEKVLSEAGAKRVELLDHIILSALGAGVPVLQPHGYLVVDIGAGTTDAALISMGRIVRAQSCRVGGNAINAALSAYLKKRFSLIVSETTVEHIKCTIGTASPRVGEGEMGVHGLNTANGKPDSVILHSSDVFEAIGDPMLRIVECVRAVLQDTPPEMAADLCDDGLILTGGTAQLNGLADLLQQATKTAVHVAENPMNAAAAGLGRVLRYQGDLKKIFMFKE